MRHGDEATLPRKLTVRAHGRKLILAKRTWESERHVLLKALVFGLYVPSYPDLFVERAIGHRYVPDLVALDSHSDPVFWTECGETAGASWPTSSALFRPLTSGRQASHQPGPGRRDRQRGRTPKREVRADRAAELPG